MGTAVKLNNVILNRGKHSILRGIDLALSYGTLNVILGSNGAGKSTLFNCISGELAYTGKIEIFGFDRQTWALNKLAQRLAILPQSSSLNFNFLSHEVVGLGRLPHKTSKQQNREIIERYLISMDVSHLANRNYQSLSGGEKQRIHLARTFAQLDHGEWLDHREQEKPSTLLLLDEPTSALDLKHQHLTLQQIKHYTQQGNTALLILHDINLAAYYADNIILLHQGYCYRYGSPEQTLTSENMATLFDIDMNVIHHPQSNRVQLFY